MMSVTPVGVNAAAFPSTGPGSEVKAASIPNEWGGVAEALDELQSIPKGGGNMFPAADGDPTGSMKTGFMRAMAETGVLA